MGKKSTKKGTWRVTLDDGTVVNTGYYPNARMAVGEALKGHKGKKVKSVKYVK